MASTFGIKVYQYDLNGNFISEFESIAAASFITKTNNIDVVVNNKRNMFTAGGFFWSTKFYIKLPKELIQKYEDRNFEKYNVPIFEYDIEGNFIQEFSSLSQITKIRKERNNIRSVLKGENKTFKNRILKLKYYKKLPKSILKQHINIVPKKIIQYTMQKQVVREWSSAYEAATVLKISRTNITRCLKNKQPSANGYIWKYK